MGQYDELTKEEWVEKLSVICEVRKKYSENSFMRKVLPDLVDVDCENKIVTLQFVTEEWEANPLGILHGGITASMFDTGCGLVVKSILGVEEISSTNMNVTYLKPIQIGDKPILKAKAIFIGRTLSHITGEIYVKEGTLLAATATMSYMVMKKPLKE